MPQFERVCFAPDFLPYQDGFELQRQVHAEVVANKRPDTVLLLEHESVYTAGKRTEEHELPDDGTPFVETNRGGKITWHGPGQLVGYPIMHLPRPIDVVGYVRYLEQVIIDVIANFGVTGIRVAGRTGVWVETETGTKKVAAIGIRVSEKVTMHGFALNVNTDLSYFDLIVPCGIQGKRVTSLAQELGHKVALDEVKAKVKSHFETVFEVTLI